MFFMRSAAVLVCAHVAGQAAALVTFADDDVFGENSLTIDTDQNLEFLDLEFTVGLSYLQVVDEFEEGGQFEGWRYASYAEVATLINNANFLDTSGQPLTTVSPVTGPGVGELFTFDEASTSRATESLTFLLGTTLPIPGSVDISQGVVADVVGNRAVSVFIADAADGLNPDIARDSVTVSSRLLDSGSELSGSFIVRVIPAPASWSALMCVGVLLARRRR